MSVVSLFFNKILFVLMLLKIKVILVLFLGLLKMVLSSWYMGVIFVLLVIRVICLCLFGD